MESCFSRSDRTSESQGKEIVKSTDTRFLYGLHSSGNRSHDTSSEKGESSSLGTENTAGPVRIKTAVILDHKGFMAEQERAGNPVDAISNFMIDGKNKKIEEFFQEFDKKFDELQESFKLIKDSEKKVKATKYLDTIRKQLRAIKNPRAVFTYANEKLQQERRNTIGELDDNNRLNYLAKFQGKINEYLLEHDSNAP